VSAAPVEGRTAGPPFRRPPDQIGCVVPDLDAAIAGWSAQGIGPFLVMRRVRLDDYRYRGQSSRPRIDVAFSQRGEQQIELIQPTDAQPSSYRDFLAAGGDGEHHHGWFCTDYAADLRAAADEGRVEHQRGRWGALHFAYYEPLAGEPMIGELIELNDLSRRIFGLIRAEAERWDGRRPSRPLLAAADWNLRRAAARVQLGMLVQRARS
jgi:hypothetical protein